MECTYCNAEMTYEGPYGKGNMAAQEKYGYGWQKIGDIYRCPNHEGFESKEEEDEYIELVGEFSDQEGESICCDSSTHNVSGSFYTDSNGNLREGYPC